jgi:hypothetical protein
MINQTRIDAFFNGRSPHKTPTKKQNKDRLLFPCLPTKNGTHPVFACAQSR